jgi:hypothetical protein
MSELTWGYCEKAKRIVKDEIFMRQKVFAGKSALEKKVAEMKYVYTVLDAAQKELMERAQGELLPEEQGKLQPGGGGK